MPLNIFDIGAILLVLTGLFSVLNHRYIRFPATIGLLVSGLLASGTILAFDHFFPQYELGEEVRRLVLQIDFTEFLMHGMLSFLLFAGALHVNLEDLMKKKAPIITLASVGVLISTLIIGYGTYWLLSWLNIPLALPYCLVFGALISPTDPIAVIGILKSSKAPKSLEIKIAGESLLNDGIGVVAFTVLVSLATGSAEGESVGLSQIATLFLKEVVGGIGLGLAAGILVYQTMKKLDEPNLEILLSFALVMGMTFIAFQFHLSAPLACVTAGLLIGNHGRQFGMSERTRDSLDLVWSFTDYAFNAILFLILGLEVVAISMKGDALLALLLLIPLVLLARFLCVSIPISVLKLKHEFTPGAIKILTWGGLRGGISVALALSLPDFPGRNVVLTATYGVVIFSIVVQGLTVKRLVEHITKK